MTPQWACYVGRLESAPHTAAAEVAEIVFEYGDRRALDGVSFSVPRGEVFGLLGPNGGGKTTLFRILSTLLHPKSGTARVLGFDVRQESLAVRERIGVVFQNQSLDRRLSVEENLAHQGRLHGLTGSALNDRIDEVVDRTGIADRRKDNVDLLSGGLRRRVELAKGLLHEPELLLLDEPSTGVDPAVRLEFWNYLQQLRAESGVTVLLTTHLLDEADKCDRLAILDQGHLVACDKPDALKGSIGGDVISLESAQPEELARDLRAGFGFEASIVDGLVRFESERGPETLAGMMQSLPETVKSVTVARPSLEDVFIQLTGHSFGERDAA